MRTTSTSTSRVNGRRLLAVALVAGIALAAVAGTVLTSGKKADAAGSPYLPGAGHVFVINLENKGYDQTWGPGSAAPYLSTTLRSKGVLLNQYFGTAHNSLPNYIGQISGQGPNPKTQGDCQSYSPFVGTQMAPPGQAVGDGCDTPCVDGQPGGPPSADTWLKKWVPAITNSPAFGRDGVLVITFDESDSPASGASACCGEGPGPNSPLPGISGLGGGRVGALVISPFVKGGTWSTTPYNHYSLLASIEDLFALPHLGYAATPGLNRFGLDVYHAGV